jgi:endonuclease/exonuclease/phosphatase family metal-dependent hydrolase
MMAADTNPAVRDSTGRLIVVSWNIHVGNGDVVSLIDRISSFEHAQGNGDPAIVLLLQESVRQSSDIPKSSGFSVPGRIARSEDKLDIAALARKLGWWMYYAPSMRNGDGAGELAEDRGNAILSSLPLQSVEPVELPFSVQRRVALVATVADTRMQPLLRVAVTHFDTRAPLTKGWIFGGPRARNKQASALLASLDQYETDGFAADCRW